VSRRTWVIALVTSESEERVFREPFFGAIPRGRVRHVAECRDGALDAPLALVDLRGAVDDPADGPSPDARAHRDLIERRPPGHGSPVQYAARRRARPCGYKGGSARRARSSAC
jgi:hypothetical protein